MLSLSAMALPLTWVGGGGAFEFDFFVDSNAAPGGNGSEALPFDEIADLTWAIGQNTAFVADSDWLEMAKPNAAVRRLIAVGSGTPPVLDGADVLSPGAFALSAHADAAGVVYEITLSRDPNGVYVSGDTYMLWENDAWLIRKTSVAACAAQAGTFYLPQPNALSSPSLAYVHPFGSTNPTSDGKTYEATKRAALLEFAGLSNVIVEGIHVTRGMSAYGCLAGGLGTTLRRVLMSKGGKHNTVVASGLMEDCICFDSEVDRSVLADGGRIPFTWYRDNAAGLSFTMRRCMALQPAGHIGNSESLFSHGSTSDLTGTSTIEGFIVNRNGVVHPNTIGASVLNDVVVRNGRADAIRIPNRAPAWSVKRALIEITRATFTNQGTILLPSSGGTAGASGELSHCGLVTKSGLAQDQFCFQAAIGGVLNLHHNTFYHANAGEPCINISSNGQAGSAFRYNIVILDASGSLRFLTASPNMNVDYNVYVRVTVGTSFWQDSTSGTAFTLSEWRSESGHDINSVLLNAAQAEDLFLNGVAGLLEGDFRLDPAYAGTFVDGTPIVGNAGIQEYFDWNTRQVLSGQPARWPEPPDTLADCEDYISDPEAWDFYPITAPAAFAVDDWSILDGNTQADVTIIALPDDGHSTITNVEYRLDGGSWVSSGGIVSFTITGLTNGVEYDVELRAINGVGAGPASDVKSVTPENVSLAAAMLNTETQGIAIDFTDDYFFAADGFYGSAKVKDTGTPANNYDSYPGGLLTYTSPSPKLCRQLNGLYLYGRHNLYLNSAAPANQSITVTAGATYAITITGTVSVTASGATTGTLTAGTTAFTAATGTLTLGSTSGSGTVHVYRTPAVTTYLPTTSAIRYVLPYEWDASGNRLGVLLEEVRTNETLFSSDFTQANWVKVNVTAAQTATGPTGVANSATTLTATLANGTALQTFVLGSATRVVSCFIKRRTGSGAVELTMNNGSTWTPVTITSGWTRVEIPSATSSNPVIGIRLTTSGDEVDVAFFQLEAGTFPTSPIETRGGTFTRAVDNITLASSKFPLSATAGTLTEQARAPNATSVNHSGNGPTGIALDNGTTGELAVLLRAASNVPTGRVDDGGSVMASITAGSWANDAVGRSALAYAANDFAFAFGGTLGTPDTAGTLPTVTTLRFGGRGGPTTGFFTRHLQTMRYLPRRATNVELQGFTA